MEINVEKYHSVCGAFAGYSLSTDGEKLLVCSSETCRVILFDLDGKVLYERELDPTCEEMYNAYCINGDNVFLAPYNAEDFIVLNTINNSVSVLYDLSRENRINGKYQRIIETERSLFVIGENVHKVLCINKDNYSLEKVFEFDEYYWIYNRLIWGDDIYIPSRNENCVLKISIKEEEIEIIRLEEKEGIGFSDIYMINGIAYLVGSTGETYSWENFKRLRLLKDREKLLTWFSCCIHGMVYRLCAYNSELIIESATGERKTVTVPQHRLPAKGCVVFQGVCRLCDYLYFLTRNGQLYRFNTLKKELEELFLNDSDRDFCQMVFNESIIKKTCREGERGDLSLLIAYLTQPVC